jgi:hypothetical protein
MKKTQLSIDIIREKIYVIRGEKVMMGSDLATLYGVSTKRLNEAVRRNIKRFPFDFMFQISKNELRNLRSQIATSSLMSQIAISKWGGDRRSPLVFTEQGIAMLSSVLNSPKAIQINIQIIRVFTKLRQMIDAYKELREKVEEMEKNNETNFREIFRVIRLIFKEEQKPKRKVGFATE